MEALNPLEKYRHMQRRQANKLEEADLRNNADHHPKFAEINSRNQRRVELDKFIY
jgi:hypothetical protein